MMPTLYLAWSSSDFITIYKALPSEDLGGKYMVIIKFNSYIRIDNSISKI